MRDYWFLEKNSALQSCFILTLANSIEILICPIYTYIYIYFYIIVTNLFAMGAGRGRKASQASPLVIFLHK
jgi:hypothetical protein